jgi:hypothetical protein
MGELTRLLSHAARRGGGVSLNQLYNLVVGDLRAIAAHTLQPEKVRCAPMTARQKVVEPQDWGNRRLGSVPDGCHGHGHSRCIDSGWGYESVAYAFGLRMSLPAMNIHNA